MFKPVISKWNRNQTKKQNHELNRVKQEAKSVEEAEQNRIETRAKSGNQIRTGSKIATMFKSVTLGRFQKQEESVEEAGESNQKRGLLVFTRPISEEGLLDFVSYS